MALRQIRFAGRSAEDRHFGRAAERMFIAQPALSQHVRRLEHELGAQLFDRGGRHVGSRRPAKPSCRSPRPHSSSGRRSGGGSAAGGGGQDRVDLGGRGRSLPHPSCRCPCAAGRRHARSPPMRSPGRRGSWWTASGAANSTSRCRGAADGRSAAIRAAVGRADRRAVAVPPPAGDVGGPGRGRCPRGRPVRHLLPRQLAGAS